MTRFNAIFFFMIILVFLLGASCDSDDDAVVMDSVSLLGDCLVEIDGEFVEVELDVAPQFLDGGEEGLLKAVYGVVLYPAEARENGIQGLTKTNFGQRCNRDVFCH